MMPNPSVRSSVAQPNDSGSWERPWWCPRCGPCPRRFEGLRGSSGMEDHGTVFDHGTFE